MPSRLHVGLVYGGLSTEHDISIRSARNVLAMLSDRHRVTPLYIARDGRWFAVPPEALAEGDRAPGARAVSFAPRSGSCTLVLAGETPEELPLDVAFPVLHGQNGEDGHVQGFLQTLGLPFVGPGTLGSAVCMDKEVAKRLMEQAGLPVTPYRVVRRGEDVDWGPLADALGTPVFVKPSSSGSSVGVTKVEREEELQSALDHAFEFDRKVLVETAVAGREVECAVLGNASPEASTPGEIVSTAQFYTYDAKYEDPDASRMEVPADLPAGTAARVRSLALRAVRALEAEGMARVDIFVADTGEAFVNEVNTIPGFTSRSMYPVMWAHDGLDGPALADRLLALALERHARDASLKTTR
jgi:D-alanine-D-alanine ligase